MNREPDAPQSASVSYTGIVCRRCTAPVARVVDDATMRCPSCGFSWEAGPPVSLRAA